MIYCNHGPKRDLLNGNWRSQQVWKQVFGAQTIDPSKKKHVEMRSLHLALKRERNDLTIIKTAFLVLSKRFKRKKMLKSRTKNCRLKSITATFLSLK